MNDFMGGHYNPNIGDTVEDYDPESEMQETITKEMGLKENTAFLKKQLTFPAEVESDAEGHVMLFHFLKPEFQPATPAFGVFRPPSAPKDFAAGASKNHQFNTMAAGGDPSANVGAFMKGYGRKASKATKAAIGGGYSTKRAKMMRTNLTVALYMPGGIKATYGQNYNNVAGGFLNNLLAQNSEQAGQAVGGAVQALVDIFKPGGLNVRTGFQGIRQMIEAVSNANLKGAGSMTGVALASSVAQTAPSITAAVAKIVNPRMEMLFQSTAPREFTYQFKMNARSKEDSDSIAEIVQAFKVWSHPNVVAKTNGNVLHYPGQFEIQFMSYGKENKYLSRISDCVLSSMGVDYNTEGQFQAFRPTGKGSAPVTVTMDLTFREATILTADMIAKGGY